MSRYYQSSYHGSNDYRKYREERLGTNNPSKGIQSKIHQQDVSRRSQYAKHNEKQYQQTFGKEVVSIYDKKPEFGSKQTSAYKKSTTRTIGRENPKNQSQLVDQSKASHEGANRLINYESKVSKYMQENCKPTEQIAHINRQQLPTKYTRPLQNTSSGYGLRSSSRPRQYQIPPQIPSIDNFQDSIISRRRNYEYLNKQAKNQGNEPTRSYNYTSKIENINKQKIQLKNFKPTESVSYSRQNQVPSSKYEQRLKSKHVIPQRVEDGSPYQSRNQMIKQRLDQPSNYENDNFVKSDNVKSQIYRGGLDTRERNTSSRYSTTQITPKKSPVPIRDDKDVSSNRRKSLIQKSQMLKQKLSRLNPSSNTKHVQNQQECFNTTNYNQKQNTTIQDESNYSKKFLASSFQLNSDYSEKLDQNVSKKLNFDQASKENYTDRRSDPALKESNQNTIKSYSRNQNNLPSDKMSLIETQRLPSSDSSGEGALKKINELNQRINSRLQSILKNYG